MTNSCQTTRKLFEQRDVVLGLLAFVAVLVAVQKGRTAAEAEATAERIAVRASESMLLEDSLRKIADVANRNDVALIAAPSNPKLDLLNCNSKARKAARAETRLQLRQVTAEQLVSELFRDQHNYAAANWKGSYTEFDRMCLMNSPFTGEQVPIQPLWVKRIPLLGEDFAMLYAFEERTWAEYEEYQAEQNRSECEGETALASVRGGGE